MRLSLSSRAAHRRRTTTTSPSSSASCSLCWCLYAVILSCAVLVVSASTLPPLATPTPTLHYDPRRLENVPCQPSLPSRSNQQQQNHHDALQRRHPRPTPAPNPNPAPEPAQFWAGWPKETITVLSTVTLTQSGNAGGGVIVPPNPQDTTVTQTAEVTTTLYDSNLPTTGTLTVIATTTVIAGGGGGGVIGGGGGNPVTTTITTTEPGASGTLTRTRTATIETRLPQETQVWTPADIPRFAQCLPGDEDYEEPGVLSLTREQKPTLIALAIMFVVILIGWNFVVIRHLLYPLKMLCVLIHEAGHVIGGLAAGRRLETLFLDPTYGGHTMWETEVNSPFPLRWPPAAMPLGYLMSAFVGATLILCGFNTLASKVASFIVGILMLVVAFNLMKAPLGMALVVGTVGLLVAFWFIDHAMYLRYYILFIGVMCCWYIIWDFIDDFVFHKMYPCCAVLHSQVFGSMQPFIWLYIYLAITALIFVGWLLIAIYVFRQSPHSMFCQGQSWLPT